MPLHRHECESCGHQFRILVAHGTQNDTPTCPECGSIETRRMMPLVAVHFKGSGYYKTDHGRKGGNRSEKTDSGNGAASKDSADTKPSDASSDSSDKKPSSEMKASEKKSDSTASTKTPSAE